MLLLRIHSDAAINRGHHVNNDVRFHISMFSNSSGFNPLNKASRITCYNCHRRHVFGHNTSCSDNRTVTDAHSRKNGGIDSNPCLIFYDYRTTIGCTAVFRIRVMIDCYQIDFRTDEYIVTDCNTATTEKSATLLNETPQSIFIIAFRFG